MSESITVQQADIHTAAVEVAIMRISGKQVTLAVYRQLKAESPVDADGHFVGLPWGTVNYHPPKECDGPDGQHFHVVWQKGSELRRGTLARPHHQVPSPDVADDWLLAASARGWRPNADWYDRNRSFGDTGWIRVSGTAGVFLAEPSRDLAEFWRWEVALFSRYGASDVRRHPDPPSLSAEQLLWDTEQAVADNYERQKQRDKRWLEVQDLPQLFIAV